MRAARRKRKNLARIDRMLTSDGAGSFKPLIEITMRIYTRLFLLVLIAALLGGCAASSTKRLNLPPLAVQEKVELAKFMGRWYVIANIPYSAEAGKVGSYVEYRPRADGRMDDLYFFRKKNFDQPIQQWTGLAWVVDRKSNARWLAQFIWPFKFDYLILATAPDYSWALVGHPGRDLAWVFARTARMDGALYEQLRAKLEAMGYDSSRVLRVPQQPADLGQPGFQPRNRSWTDKSVPFFGVPARREEAACSLPATTKQRRWGVKKGCNFVRSNLHPQG
jgi:apolipoprotein D and lipocalin family protein